VIRKYEVKKMNARRTLSAIDLYAGAGGLSFGLTEAGIRIEAAVEQDAWAATTYKNNISSREVVIGRVSDLPERFFASYKGIDLVVGGPPCQGFSVTTGSRKGDRVTHIAAGGSSGPNPQGTQWPPDPR
jgi:site-specific DNA-cytosine methylase